MTWARLDDAILDNPKIAKAGVFGFAMHVAAITWCARNLTDGHLPYARVTALLPLNSVQIDVANPLALPGGDESLSGATGLDPYVVADHLVDVGLWHRTATGYALHDYLEYNPSKLQVLAERERCRNRQKKRRTSGGSHGVTSPEVPSNFGVNSDLPVPVPVSVPKRESEITRAREGSNSEQPRPMPLDWKPHPAAVAELAQWARCSPVDVQAVADEFKSYWTIGKGMGRERAHWQTKFREHFRRHVEEGRLKTSGPTGRAPKYADADERRRVRNGLIATAETGELGKPARAWAMSGAELSQLADLLERGDRPTEVPDAVRQRIREIRAERGDERPRGSEPEGIGAILSGSLPAEPTRKAVPG
jgi:DnaT-like ssDNA binding protein